MQFLDQWYREKRISERTKTIINKEKSIRFLGDQTCFMDERPAERSRSTKQLRIGDLTDGAQR